MSDKGEAYFCNVHKPNIFITYDEALERKLITKTEYRVIKRQAEREDCGVPLFVGLDFVESQGIIVKLSQKDIRCCDCVEITVVEKLAKAGALTCSLKEITDIHPLNVGDQDERFMCDVYVGYKPVYQIEIFRIFDKETK
jgi:hypothetical protein